MQCLQLSQVEHTAGEDEAAEEEQQPAEAEPQPQAVEEARPQPQPKRRGRPPKAKPATSEAAAGKKVRGCRLVGFKRECSICIAPCFSSSFRYAASACPALIIIFDSQVVSCGSACIGCLVTGRGVPNAWDF